MARRPALSPPPPAVPLEMGQTWVLWQTAVARRISPHGARRAAPRRVWASLRGLLSPVERNNGWQRAAAVGDPTPSGVPHLLGRARWDAAEVCKACGTYGVAPRGEPQAVRVLDETGFLKPGPPAAGGGTAIEWPSGSRGAWSNRGVRDVCQRAGARRAGSGTLSPPGVAPGRDTLCVCRHAGGARGCPQAATRPAEAGTGVAGLRPGGGGGWRERVWR